MGIFAAISGRQMYPPCKFLGLALPEEGRRYSRVVLVAGVMAMLSGCGRSPTSEDGKIIRTTVLVRPERATVNPPVVVAARPFTAEELARQSQLEAELATE